MQRWSASREASTEYGDVYVFCELEEDPTGDYVRYEDYKAALAEAEKTIGALKHRIGEIEDERGKEIQELKADLVWAVLHRAHIHTDGQFDYYRAVLQEPDLTDAGILAALQQAKEQSDGER